MDSSRATHPAYHRAPQLRRHLAHQRELGEREVELREVSVRRLHISGCPAVRPRCHGEH